MTWHRSLALILSVALVTFGVPRVASAQVMASKSATLRGQVVDAGGRGASGLRVELVRDQRVLAATFTVLDGHFDFKDLEAGNYIVRTTVKGQPSGVRVVVTPGDATASALIVLPSVAKASAQVGAVIAGTLSGVLNTVATVIAVTVTTIGNTVYVQAQKEEDQQKVEQLVQAAQEFLIQLGNQIIANNPQPPGSPPRENPFIFIPTAPPTSNPQ